ncbi:MAG: hypothetical protein ABFQ64_07065 [Campylobacterota bacterium]
MAKILGAILIGVYFVWYFTAQGVDTSTEDIFEQEVRFMESSAVGLKLTQTQMYDVVKNTVEREGWSTTEFKSNTLIAEKTSNNNSESVTVTFSKSEFSISPENSGLQNAINTALGI